MTENVNETLTAVQIIELSRLEALIVENLRGGRNRVAPRADEHGFITLVIDPAELETPAHREMVNRDIQLTAELICYLAAEGIDYAHFHGRDGGGKFVFAFNGCSILRSRRDLFAEPESYGYAVLIAAGFRPPSDGGVQIG